MQLFIKNRVTGASQTDCKFSLLRSDLFARVLRVINIRNILRTAGPVLSALILAGCMIMPGNHQPRGLMVDLLSSPEEAVITNPVPLFSWMIDDERHGARQTAWQVMVASSEKIILREEADMWNSGRNRSDRSVNVPFGGEPLEPFKTYWWRVRIWDKDGRAGRWSRPQSFNTGGFDGRGLRWPGESRWAELDRGGRTEYVFEDRHAIRYHEIKPVSVARNESGNHFITFEKAAFGTLRLTLDEPVKADTLIIHLGEKPGPRQTVDRKPGGSISYKEVRLAIGPGSGEYLLELPRQYSNYPNSQILAEHMPEVTSFRYAEIEGWEGTLGPDQVSQHALLYRFDDNSSRFDSSDENLNLIWDLCKHTLKATPFLGLYIDGTRERMPYEADAYIQQISHYCVDREFAIQRYTTAFLIFNPSWPAEWHLHIVLMAWADYMATGDVRFLDRYYDELRKKTLLPLAREDGLISTRTGLVTDEFLETIHYRGTSFRDIVDWPQGIPANEESLRRPFGSARIEGETDRYVFSDINTVVNAFHYRNLVLMEKIAGVLGKSEEEAFFRERAALVKTSFNEKLLNHDTGLYRDGEGVDHSALHANMFPVAFGLAPEEYYPQLREFIISRGMACSPYGAPYLFDALYELGADDYALELLTSESDRSWMNMINFGTTITSEAWDIKYKNNMTWNHAWGASPAYIITRRIFGIEPLEPAFRKILISPRPATLKSAEIISPTIRGAVHARFSNEPGGAFEMEIVIPANTGARVMLPVSDNREYTLLVNGEKRPFTIGDGSVVIDDLESGRYLLRLERK